MPASSPDGAPRPSSLRAAPQAGEPQGGEAGRHYCPGRGLGDRRGGCSPQIGDHDLAAPGMDVALQKRIRPAVERAAAATAAAGIDVDAGAADRSEEIPL